MSTNINSTEQIVEINAGDQITNVNIVSQSTTQVISGEQVVTVDVNAGTIPAAWGSITGTLSNQTDLQNALNAKQNNITLTTTGTTGVATLVGSTLNIPNYVSSTKQSQWDSAYNDKINSAEVSGTTTKTLTLTQQDGGIIQASWSDFDTAPVTSVFGRTGDVVATEGDYNINQLGDVTITSATNGQVLKYNGTAWVNAADASGLTSVGLAMPSAFIVSGSPLTSNGTITVTGAGTTSQYVRGDGSLANFPSVSNEAKTLIREVYNKTGATLTKGTVIYIDGGQGNLPTVTKAIATGDPTSAQTFGIVQSDITNMNNGFVVVAGGIDNLDTQAYTEGTALYLSPTTAGAWTSTKPYAPDHMVYLGVVVRSHPTQGVIEVKIQNGVELDEIHDVSARFPVNKDGLFYNSTSGVWENKSIAGVLGYTPVPESRIITINGTAQNLSADRTWNVGTVTQVAASGGTGISVAGSPVTGSGTITITNTAPDQVVGLTGAGTTSISGTYPNFTITSNDQYTGTVTSVAASGGTGISISGSPVTGSGTISITNTAPDQIVSLTGAGTTSISGTYPNFTVTSNDQYVGTVTSVNATVPTGFEVSGVPITSAGTVDIKFASGYSLPTNAKQTQWDDAYAKRINSLTVTGNSGSSTLTSNVLNVPTYTLSGLGGEPAITAGTTSQYWRGDKSFQTLDTSVVPENGNVYFTEPRVRATVLSGLNITGGSISASDSVLNAFGKVQNQINGLIGGSIFQSTWNASTNTPSLASGVGTKGYYYIVSVAGTTNLDGITDWQIGDWAIFDGTVWRKVDNTDAVVSVNGYTGVVNLVLDDLADVSAASPTDTQLLRFNGTTSKWYNWTPTFEPALTKGNLTEATSAVLTITGGTGAVIGSGTTIQVKSASAAQDGIVTTGTQTFAGAKTFTSPTLVSVSTTSEFALNVQSGSTFAFGTTNGKRIAIFNHPTLEDCGLQFGFDSTDKTGIIAGSANTTGAGIDFYTYNGTSWANRARITKNGAAEFYSTISAVGGTMSGKLIFNFSTDVIEIGHTTNNSGNILFKQDGTNYYDIDFSVINGKIGFYDTNTSAFIWQFGVNGTDKNKLIHNGFGGTLIDATGKYLGNTVSTDKWATARTLTIGSTGKSVDGSANVSWTLAEIGAQAALTNPVTGTGTIAYIPKFTSTGSTIGNSIIYDEGSKIGISTSNPRDTFVVSNNGAIVSERFSGATTFSGDLYFFSARGTSSSPTAKLNGDVAMGIRARAFDGTTFIEAASIESKLDGVTATNVVYGNLLFSTNNGGTSTSVKMTINPSGTIRMNSYTTNGILKVSGGDGTIGIAVAGDFPTLNQNTTGSAATLTTARNFTINGTAKSFDGSANVSWTAAEIGLTSYLPLSGGTLTGSLNGTTASFSSGVTQTTIEAISSSDTRLAVKSTGNLTSGFYIETRNAGTLVGNSTIRITNTGAFQIYNGTSSDALNFQMTSSGAASFTSSLTASSWSGVLSVVVGTSSSFGFGINQQSTFAFGSTNGKRVVSIMDGNSADNGLQFGYDTTDKTGIIAGAATSAGTGIDFYTYNGTAWGNRGRITKDGDYGIGTGTPLAKLHIVGSSGGALLRLDGSVNTKFIFKVTGGSDDPFTLFRNHTTAGNLDIMTWTYSGKVGINTTTPNKLFTVRHGDADGIRVEYTGNNDNLLIDASSIQGYNNTTASVIKLNVSGGNVLIGTSTNGTGKLQVNGSVYATSFFESSDIRLKNVIEKNPKANLNLDVLKFTRKVGDDKDQVRFGYSAQQVKELMPELVVGKEYLSVNYIDVHTLKIASLEEEIKQLKNKLNELGR